MAKEIDQEIAALLWEKIGVTVDKVRVQPRAHRGEVTFIGYADILVFLFDNGVTIPLLTLCGNSIKTIGGEIHFDPKAEPGKGSRNKEYFPHWYPSSAELRKVITMKLAEDPGVQEMVATANAKLGESAQA